MKMTINEIHNKLILFKLEGYVLGLERSEIPESRMSHVYKGEYDDLHTGMCKKAYNRDNGNGFSIFRNNLGKGICRTCLKNTLKDLTPHPTS